MQKLHERAAHKHPQASSARRPWRASGQAMLARALRHQHPNIPLSILHAALVNLNPCARAACGCAADGRVAL